jgi:hypothetical protein
MDIPCIYMVNTVTSTYSRKILCIYHVNTWYLHGIYSDIYIFKEYSMYIPCIYNVFTWIYMVYHVLMLHLAAQLMLRRRTGSHSTCSTSNDIAWTNHNFNLSPILWTLAILAPGKVDVQGTPGTENSLEVPCLTGKTYKLIFLALNHSRLQSGPKDNDNQTHS